VGMIIFLICNLMFSDASLLSNATLMAALKILTISVAIIIVAVPEGLPLAVSISMAFSVDTMKAQKLLVKNMEACENLGTIREICTGKTATLTTNEMRVNRFYTGGMTIINSPSCLRN